MLEPDTKTHFALWLLGFNEIDAVTVWFGKISDWSRRYVVYGYSTVLTLLRTDPNDYGPLMERSCEVISAEPVTLSAESELEDLFSIFAKRRFGFAYIEKDGGATLGGFANLRDLITLYEKSIIKTDLLVGEVASYPIVSVSGDSNLRETLDTMIKKNVRRVLVSNTRNVVSDRDIINHICSMYRLNVSDKLPNILEANLRDLKGVQSESAEIDLPVEQAAKIIYEKGGCLLCEEGIVTPWYLVMKPWVHKGLSIAD